MRILALLSRTSAFAAGVCLIAIAGIVLAQITVRLTGNALPSTDDFAAWAMGGAVFLALPSAFFHGKHIRVTLAIERIAEVRQRPIVRAMNFCTLAVFAAATWYCAVFVYESFVFGDKSQGIVPISLWIPQTSMLFGLALCLPILAAMSWLGVASLGEQISQS